MVLRRVDCGLPLFHGFLTQAARSQRGSLFIGILLVCQSNEGIFS
jgi:hypothetical protein